MGTFHVKFLKIEKHKEVIQFINIFLFFFKFIRRICSLIQVSVGSFAVFQFFIFNWFPLHGVFLAWLSD